MQDRTAEPKRFRPEMPHIPGVSDDSNVRSGTSPKRVLRLIILAAAALATLGGLAWWQVQKDRSAAGSEPADSSAEASSAALPFPRSSEQPVSLPSAPGTIATLEELSKPWLAKKFTFLKPDTHTTVDAMVVRLPGSSGNHSGAYWAFAMAAPYGRCALDYVTDLKQLANRYNYSATHPMVAADCNGTLYDPLRLGVIPSGAWVRGEVVQGSGIRPPISIRIQVRGRSIIADQIE